MESARVVELLHDRGESASPRWLLGSGFLVKAGVVLTAAHNLGDADAAAGPHGTVVRCLDATEHEASVLIRSDPPEGLDLALLAVPTLQATAARVGRVDRDHIDVVRDVMAPGFPNFKHAEDRPEATRRQPAQPTGSVPTVEDLSAGELTLKIDSGAPNAPAGPGTSPWEGLSGAGVIVGEHLIGVAVRHHLAEGLGALRVLPLSRLVDLPGREKILFCSILDIDDAANLPVVEISGSPNDATRAVEVSPDLVRELTELKALADLGLLGPGDLQTLRVTAVKESKGWR